MTASSGKLKIGIYGSAAGNYEDFLPLAKALGDVLAEYSDRLVLITGACPGLPYAVIEQAAPSGIEIWGFSSSTGRESHMREYPEQDLSIYSKLIYVPKDFPYAGNMRICMKYRNISSTVACDAGIFISGRWGTLNEFTNLIDFKKPAGVLAGSGGIADELPGLARKIHKEGQGSIVFESDPQALVERLLGEVRPA